MAARRDTSAEAAADVERLLERLRCPGCRSPVPFGTGGGGKPLASDPGAAGERATICGIGPAALAGSRRST
jgi:hypothetical protein